MKLTTIAALSVAALSIGVGSAVAAPARILPIYDDGYSASGTTYLYSPPQADDCNIAYRYLVYDRSANLLLDSGSHNVNGCQMDLPGFPGWTYTTLYGRFAGTRSLPTGSYFLAVNTGHWQGGRWTTHRVLRSFWHRAR